MVDTEALAEIGLSDREIAVYMALMELGSTTTGPLTKSSNVPSAKIYEVLGKLTKKGLATYTTKGNIKYFQATDPNTLINLFEEKKAGIQKLAQELGVIRKKQEPEYETRVYEGARAMKAAFYEMYDYIGKSSEYRVFPIGEQLGSEELVQFWAQVFRKRVDMKIVLKTMPNIQWRKIFEKFYRGYKLIDIRYTDQEFPTGIFIFKDHVLDVLWGEKPIAFLIKSRENSERWRRFFDEQWERAKA